MAFLNRVSLIGNLGADPDLRHTASGTAVATLKIATNHNVPDADGKLVEHTEWHRVVVWGKLAETCASYLAKGRTVFAEGRLQTRSYEDSQGQKKWVTEIVANTVQFLGSPQAARDAKPALVDEVAELPF